MRRRFAPVALIAALLLTSACSPVSPTTSASARAVALGGAGDLALKLPGRGSSFNPFAPVGSTDQMLALAQFQTLVVAPQGHIDPRLAIGWRFEEDHTRVRIDLVDGAWSDGRPLTAEDVAFTLQQTLRPANHSPLAALLAPVVGAREVASGTSDTLGGVTVAGPHQLVVQLTEPDPAFMERLVELPILPRHVYTGRELGAPATFAEPGVGSGAYLFAGWRPEGVTLSPNPRFGPTRLASVHLDFANGQPPTDPAALQVVLGLDPRRLDELPAGILARSAPGKRLLALRGLHGRLDDLRVRRALMSALDREALLRELDAGRGRVTDSLLFTPDWAQAAPRRYAPDPAGARALLTAAGWDPARPLRVVVLSDTERDWAPLIEQWSQVGVAAQVQTRSPAERTAVLTDPQVDAVVETLAMPTPEPALIAPWVSCSTAGDPSGPNPGGYCNPELQRQLDRARHGADPEHRRDDFQAVWTTLADELPVLPLWVPDDVVVAPRRVDGVNPSVVPQTAMMELWGR